MNATDDAGQRREYAHHRAAHFFALRVFGKQARVARRAVIAHIKHRDLPVKAHARARHQRFFVRDTCAINCVARGEVVAAVEHHIGLGDQRVERRAGDPLFHQLDFCFGIDRRQRIACRLHLGLADRLRAMHDLPLQVGQINVVVVAQRECAHAGRREIQRNGRTQPARADQQCPRRAQFFLPFDADLRQQDVAAVTQQLLVVHRVHRSSNLECAETKTPRGGNAPGRSISRKYLFLNDYFIVRLS